MKKKLLHIITIAGFVLYTQTLLAQAPPSGGGQPQGQPPSGVPIDGGASLLLVGAAGYAYKRLKEKKGE